MVWLHWFMFISCSHRFLFFFFMLISGISTYYYCPLIIHRSLLIFISFISTTTYPADTASCRFFKPPATYSHLISSRHENLGICFARWTRISSLSTLPSNFSQLPSSETLYSRVPPLFCVISLAELISNTTYRRSPYFNQYEVQTLYDYCRLNICIINKKICKFCPFD